LTISIPTWNRSVYLKELLEQLIEQVSGFQLEKQIDILVSNNDSSDDTETIVLALKAQHSFIKYHRNPENIGAKSNVIRSMEMADSDFVMVLGDDDRIRKDCLKDILFLLNTLDRPGVLIDKSNSKVSGNFENQVLPLNILLENFYWYMGNAGMFIVKSEYMRNLLRKFDHDYLNECWPQTQAMIFGSIEEPGNKIYVHNLSIHARSIHDEVMVYNSFYLWRTCTLELLNSINAIKEVVNSEIYYSARKYIKSNMPQQLFNILQCGIFVDNRIERTKTRKHIASKIYLFAGSEKIFLFFIVAVLSFPAVISRFLSNVAIFLLKGSDGLRKKNHFVKHELEKKIRLKTQKSSSIRTLEFEIDN